MGKRVARRRVIRAEHDNGAHVAPQDAWIGTPVAGLGHPLHVALRPVGKPGVEARAGERDGIGGDDAADVEAEFARPCFQRAAQIGPRAVAFQKSRSA